MDWIPLCAIRDLPAPGQMREKHAGQRQICLANDAGVLFAIDNICPHRGGALAEGTLEEGKVLCPWHAWAFDLKTGLAEHNGRERVAVHELRMDDDYLSVKL